MINLSPELLAALGGILGAIFLVVRGNIWKGKAEKSKARATAAKAQSQAHEASKAEEKKTIHRIKANKEKVSGLKKISDVIAYHIDRVREANTKRKDTDTK